MAGTISFLTDGVVVGGLALACNFRGSSAGRILSSAVKGTVVTLCFFSTSPTAVAVVDCFFGFSGGTVAAGMGGTGFFELSSLG